MSEALYVWEPQTVAEERCKLIMEASRAEDEASVHLYPNKTTKDIELQLLRAIFGEDFDPEVERKDYIDWRRGFIRRRNQSRAIRRRRRAVK